METICVLDKVLSHTDTNHRFHLPAASLKHLPQFPMGQNHLMFEARDKRGRVWKFELVRRSNGAYPKTVISCGTWLPFVIEKDLEAGHRVILEKIQDSVSGDVYYNISANTIKLFGQRITI